MPVPRHSRPLRAASPATVLVTRLTRLALLALPALGAPRDAAAQTAAIGAAMPSASDPRPVARAARRTGPVSVDGRLDDAAWAAATPITEFRQQLPDEGRPASQRTELRILFDDEALYVGARMYDSLGAAGVRAVMA